MLYTLAGPICGNRKNSFHVSANLSTKPIKKMTSQKQSKEMEERMKVVLGEIGQLTEHYVQNLVINWKIMFDNDITIHNLNKVVDHTKCFFEEVFEETESRKAKMDQKVAELEREQRVLAAILKCDLSLLRANDQPLFTYQCELDEQLEYFRDQVRVRKDKIAVLLKREIELCLRLDHPTKGLDYSETHLPSQNDMEEFEFYLNEMESLCEERQEKIVSLQFQIQSNAAEIELEIKSKLLGSDQKLSAANIEDLKQLLHKVSTEKYNIKTEITEKWATLEGLYSCLDTSPRSRVDRAKSTLTKTTLMKLNGEIERCEKLKRANVKRIIEKLRVQIEEYWEMIMMSDKERARFSNFTNDCYTEDLLLLHEMELNDLKQFYYRNSEIFEKYEQHKILWDRAVALEAREHDPNRYKNRGGNLLMEEKERRQVDKELAKLRKDLAALAAHYESEQNRPFTVRGANITETIDELYAGRRLAKEQQMSARKANATIRLGAPTSSVTMSASRAMSSRTPMSVTRFGDKTALLKRTASTTKLNFPPSASKRQKITVTLGTPAKMPLAKRCILSELTPSSTTPNVTAAKFRKPASRKPSKVIDTLISGRRKSSHSRRSSANKSLKKGRSAKSKAGIATDSDQSYVQFEEEMTVRSRSSIKPTAAAPIRKRPPTPRRKSPGTSTLKLSATANMMTPSPRSKRLPEFF